LHRSQYVYINFQVIISITYVSIDNSLGPLARDSPCMFIYCEFVSMNTEDILMFNNFFKKYPAFYEIMLGNIVESNRHR